ncbi:MAG: hypothetical protein GQ564_16760 [Bacteroidales bacterium]|nr:hypothetical protein [Bacteroidales bacterium]
MKVNFSVLIVLIFLISCTNQSKQEGLNYKILNSTPNEYIIPNNPSIRGLDVFDSETVWLSGSKGIFAVSSDKGKIWKSGTINNDTLLDFRDIVAFGKESAIAISAGSPARIYKTTDKGNTWKLTYENNDPNIFFDSFEFWNDKEGIACADPLDGDFFFILTHDGGNTWSRIPSELLPKPLAQEGGFAASGTCIALAENGIAMFGTGGDKARIILTHDFGKTWKAVDTPIKANNPTFSIYSVSWIKDETFAITGGNYLEPDIADNNFAISTDNGNSWSATPTMPNGFRSCVKPLNKTNTLVVCGRNGVDLSNDFGETWIKTELPAYYTFDISPNEDFIVFAGSEGRVGFISLNPQAAARPL